jgi:flagellar motor switch/type III secretory pathway protein FliN
MDSTEVMQRFAALPFAVEAELGTLTLSIGEILALREGAVLRTDHAENAPFVLYAGGAEIAAAEAVVVGDSLAMRVRHLSAKASGSHGAD